MIYQANDYLGNYAAAAASIFSAGKAGYTYIKGSAEHRANTAAAKTTQALTEAEAQDAAEKAGYAEYMSKLTAAIDMDKAKRYIITGAAIGIPLIVGYVLMKKG